MAQVQQLSGGRSLSGRNDRAEYQLNFDIQNFIF